MTTRPADPAAVGQHAAALVAEQRALEAAGALARAGTTLRHRLDEVVAEDDPAWWAYASAVDAAVGHLQTELVLAGARLSSQRALGPDEVLDAAEAASHLARQRLDDLRVQVHLGRLDVTALAERAVGRLEQLARTLRDGSRRVRYTASGSFDELRGNVDDAIHDAHRALMAVAAAARSGDITFDDEDDAR